jgi:hypothetical protein
MCYAAYAYIKVFNFSIITCNSLKLVRPIREIAGRRGETTGHSVRPSETEVLFVQSAGICV